MIVSPVHLLAEQTPSLPLLQEAIKFLNQPDIADLPDGRIEISGDRVFAIVERYETKTGNPPRFEYHKKYIDVQCILEGEEIIGWSPVDRMIVTDQYDQDRDIAFGTVSGAWTPVLVTAGQACVLFPGEGHAPKLPAGRSGPVHKIVVKVVR